jgi:Bifunctional DNA primase/polymerase, N-terminal
MNDDSYLAKLESAGNIGVALGVVSNGLITIDLDQDSHAEALLAANPLLANTLRTRAARGCNIWVRFSDSYPPLQKLKNPFGNEIGEWRSDGSQTIIAGTHPEGMPYHFVVEKPAITIAYRAIGWPECITVPRATESSRVRGVGENNVVGLGAGKASCSSIEAFCYEDAISQLASTDFHQNNASLFKLAQYVRDYEAVVRRTATTAELEFVFNRWCEAARRFWRHTREDYWAEFLQACYYARFGLDQDPVELAISRAKAEPLPELTGYKDERVRLLAAICGQMNCLVGDDWFFLPTRKLGHLLGASWGSVARWLVGFEPLGILHLAPGEVRMRGGTRSPRYHYGRRDQCERCTRGSQIAPQMPFPELYARCTRRNSPSPRRHPPAKRGF